MAKVVFSPLAQADLDEAAGYMENVLYNPRAARAFVQNIERQTSVLHDYPEMGTPLQDKRSNVLYRRLICGNYVVIYHIDLETVFVDRILYGHRDYLTLLFGREANNEKE